jgi:hypothetical protein
MKSPPHCDAWGRIVIGLLYSGWAGVSKSSATTLAHLLTLSYLPTMHFAGFLVIALASLNASEPEWVCGINLNGPGGIVDGRVWEGDDSSRMTCNGQRFENRVVGLQPPLRGATEQMIRSSRWGRDFELTVKDLDDGDYQVVLYVWEDNASSTFSIRINDQVVQERFQSGTAGTWTRLGPFPARPSERSIRITSKGGDANFSGIEIWSGSGPLPVVRAAADPGLDSGHEAADYFESRIRPLLVEKCYSCHSQEASELGGGLLLDSAPGWRLGGDSGIPVIVPGSPDRSLMVIALEQHHEAWSMPPDERLSDREIGDVVHWIEMGAYDPRVEGNIQKRDGTSTIDWESAKDFWSLRPVQEPSVPEVSEANWCDNPIDAFILSAMQAQGLQPTSDADRRTLLRRASYDLTGLPPTMDEMDRFANDSSQMAFENAIERMMKSPQYGERWGRHWLDLVRYSDTAGDNSDFPIPQMALYRNWVIRAFQSDMPYDRFLTEQLAGDLMEGGTDQDRYDRIVATGYIANARRFGSRVDDYPQHLTIEDTLDNLGRALLGTTLNCARCHHHKFDPIPTEDYYGLYGIFSSTRYPWPGIELDQRQREFVPLVDEATVQQVAKERAARRAECEQRLQSLEKAKEKLQGSEREALEPQIKEARAELGRVDSTPLPYPTAYAVAESNSIGSARLQHRGDPTKIGATVPRRFLTMLGGSPLDPSNTTSGRLSLAHWITDPSNPLTARVMVNRIWQHHFGRGLVKTPNDFGRQGKPPSHPELLDWLARRFIESGWSIQAMHRLIMTSHTYRLSSIRSPGAAEIDPTHVWLSSHALHRLDAESLRDTLLFLAGRLDFTPGGEHPFPPPEQWKFTQHHPFKAVYETSRRSVYLMTQRIQRHPYLAIFDGADPSASTAMRMSSTTPLQALYFLNSDFFAQQCEAITEHVLRSASSDRDRVQWLYRMCLQRSADVEEEAAILEALQSLSAVLDTAGSAPESVDHARWNAIVRSVLRLNEFMVLE